MGIVVRSIAGEELEVDAEAIGSFPPDGLSLDVSLVALRTEIMAASYGGPLLSSHRAGHGADAPPLRDLIRRVRERLWDGWDDAEVPFPGFLSAQAVGLAAPCDGGATMSVPLPAAGPIRAELGSFAVRRSLFDAAADGLEEAFGCVQLPDDCPTLPQMRARHNHHPRADDPRGDPSWADEERGDWRRIPYTNPLVPPGSPPEPACWSFLCEGRAPLWGNEMFRETFLRPQYFYSSAWVFSEAASNLFYCPAAALYCMRTYEAAAMKEPDWERLLEDAGAAAGGRTCEAGPVEPHALLPRLRPCGRPTCRTCSAGGWRGRYGHSFVPLGLIDLEHPDGQHTEAEGLIRSHLSSAQKAAICAVLEVELLLDMASYGVVDRQRVRSYRRLQVEALPRREAASELKGP